MYICIYNHYYYDYSYWYYIHIYICAIYIIDIVYIHLFHIIYVDIARNTWVYATTVKLSSNRPS